MRKDTRLDNFEKAQLNMYLTGLASGETAALDRIYLLVSRQMYALARNIVKNKHDAEDVVQDSFIKIAENINKFRRDSNGYAWIMKITRNTALDFLRRKGRLAEENIDDFFNLSIDDYDENKRDFAIMIEMAMKKLLPIERRLIYYSYFMEMTVREISKELGISKSSVARQLKKAEENLKNIINCGTNGNF